MCYQGMNKCLTVAERLAATANINLLRLNRKVTLIRGRHDAGGD